MEIRPVDGNALLTFPNVNWVYQYDETGEYIKYKAIPVEAIEKAPTLDLAPVVHGYWKHEEPVKDDGQKPFVCSTCGLRHPRYGDVDKAYFSYCPWCGTPMDAEGDADDETT